MTSTEAGPPSTVGGGRYTLGELIGRGGAAEVYVARDELLGRDVAVKLFPPGVGEADESRRQREVQTLAGLNHPGLVTIYDVGQEGSRAFFVMQLIEGESLADRLRGGPLALGDVVALASALADALTYVHRHGVVHRDIKPGNVLLDDEGRPHLSDFGIAVLADATNITATGMVIGTASYLSPEQVRGQQVGPASDVYALGLVLLECITGRREFPGNALEAAVARLHRAPEIPPDLPGPLAGLLTAMTLDDPAERPTTEQIVGETRVLARDVGLDAETVLAPAPTGSGAIRTTAMGPGTGATAYANPLNGPTQRLSTPSAGWASGPPSTRGDRTALVGGNAPGYAGPASAGPPPAAPRNGRRAMVLGLLAVLVIAGGIGVYAFLNRSQDTPAPAVAPPSPAVVVPTTTSQTRASEETTTRRRATTTVPTTSLVPPPTSAPPTTDTPTTTDTGRSDQNGDGSGSGNNGNGNGNNGNGNNGNGGSTRTTVSLPLGGGSGNGLPTRDNSTN